MWLHMCDVEEEHAKSVGICTVQYNPLMGAPHVPVDGSLLIWFGDLRGSISGREGQLS